MKFRTLAALAGLSLASVSTAFAADITGAGATFPFPLYSKWAEAYKAATGNGLNYQSIGSGGGIRQIKANTVDFGASDMPLEGADLEKDGLIQFPSAIGAEVPAISVPGIEARQMKLTGPVLAEIYLGKIKKWDDAKIKELNPDLKLPERRDQCGLPLGRLRHDLRLDRLPLTLCPRSGSPPSAPTLR